MQYKIVDRLSGGIGDFLACIFVPFIWWKKIATETDKYQFLDPEDIFGKKKQ